MFLVLSYVKKNSLDYHNSCKLNDADKIMILHREMSVTADLAVQDILLNCCYNKCTGRKWR
jgi:hypothetical protein